MSITEVSDPTKLYSLTVKSQHNFFVTKRDILSHNFTFTVIWVVGEGIAFEEMAAVLASGLAGWGLGKLFYRSDNNGTSNNLPNNLPPNSPRLPNDDEDEIKIFEKNAEHMFCDREGHMKDTLENRKLLLDLVNDKQNFLGRDQHGNACYGKNLPNGKQVWASVWNKTIRNGGLNKVPHTFNSKTGLSNLLPPR